MSLGFGVCCESCICGGRKGDGVGGKRFGNGHYFDFVMNLGDVRHVFGVRQVVGVRHVVVVVLWDIHGDGDGGLLRKQMSKVSKRVYS